METYHKEIITSHYNKLVDLTNWYLLLPKLKMRNVPVSDYKGINFLDKKKLFFKDIQNLPDGFQILITGLKESGQWVLAKILEDDRNNYARGNVRKVSTSFITTVTIEHRDTIGRLSDRELVRRMTAPPPTPPRIPNAFVRQTSAQTRTAIQPPPLQQSTTVPFRQPPAHFHIPRQPVQQQSTATPFRVTRFGAGISNEEVAKTVSQYPHENFNINLASGCLNIRVKGATKFLDDPSNIFKPYPMRRRIRGILLLINNITFKDKDERRGAEVDEYNLKELFLQLGFIVHVLRDLKLVEMERAIKNFTSKENKDLKRADCCFLIINSHGNMGKSVEESVVISTDGKQISTTWIIEKFTGNHCPNMLMKPKIIMFNCCRGSGVDKGVAAGRTATDGELVGHSTIRTTSSYADILVAFSTVPGYVSIRNLSTGSWYIRCLCEVFMEQACNNHVEDLLKLVSNQLLDLRSLEGEIQTPLYQNYSFRPCFLHPNLHVDDRKIVKGVMKGIEKDVNWTAGSYDSQRRRKKSCIVM